ncbi:MAG: Flp family type IVb pilin [Bacillota bacterium]
MFKLLTDLWNDESGQGMAEYGLILALVAVVAIAGFKILGSGVNKQVTEVGNTINNAATTTTTTTTP